MLTGLLCLHSRFATTFVPKELTASKVGLFTWDNSHLVVSEEITHCTNSQYQASILLNLKIIFYVTMYDYLHSKHVRVQWTWMYIRFQLDNMLFSKHSFTFLKRFHSHFNS